MITRPVGVQLPASRRTPGQPGDVLLPARSADCQIVNVPLAHLGEVGLDLLQIFQLADALMAAIVEGLLDQHRTMC